MTSCFSYSRGDIRFLFIPPAPAQEADVATRMAELFPSCEEATAFGGFGPWSGGHRVPVARRGHQQGLWGGKYPVTRRSPGEIMREERLAPPHRQDRLRYFGDPLSGAYMQTYYGGGDEDEIVQEGDSGCVRRDCLDYQYWSERDCTCYTDQSKIGPGPGGPISPGASAMPEPPEPQRMRAQKPKARRRAQKMRARHAQKTRRLGTYYGAEGPTVDTSPNAIDPDASTWADKEVEAEFDADKLAEMFEGITNWQSPMYSCSPPPSDWETCKRKGGITVVKAVDGPGWDVTLGQMSLNGDQVKAKIETTGLGRVALVEPTPYLHPRMTAQQRSLIAWRQQRAQEERAGLQERATETTHASPLTKLTRNPNLPILILGVGLGLLFVGRRQ